MAILYTLLSTRPLAPGKTLRCLFATMMGIALGPSGVQAATITLTATDAYGITSFNAAGHWSNGAPPTSGNAYVDTGFVVRTPPYTTGSFTFAGDSLTINGGGTLAFKYPATFTINNLILDGAKVSNWELPSPKLAGNITLGSGGAIFSPNFAQANFTVTALISGSGGVSTQEGPGIITLSAANTYTGDTTITTANLQLNNANAVQNSTAVINMDNGLVFGSGIGTFNLGGLAGSNLVTLADTASNSVTLSVGGNGQTTMFAGTLTGNGAMNKTGTGTTILTGTNSYSGGTMIGGGRLEVDGSLAGPVTVNSGGILSGTGSVGSVSVNTGGHLAPGDGPGILTLLGSLSLQPHLILDYEVGMPSASDEVSMPGQLLALTGQQFSDFNFTPLAGFGPGTYTLMDAGSISGSLGTSTSGMIGGYAATLTVQNNNDLILNVTPEPSTLVLLGVGAVGLLGYVAWQRKRRRFSASLFLAGAPSISLDDKKDLQEDGPATLSLPSRWADVARRAA